MIALRTFWFGCLLFCCLAAQGVAGPIPAPPAPKRYVEDKASLLAPAAAESLNKRLEDYEKSTSNQVVVAIYPSLPPGAELAQFSTDTFEAWGVGQKREDNGVVIFIFSQDRKMFIATGRGLEGALPDATCKTIITEEMVPRFKQGDYAGGIDAAVTAIMAAAKGEYQGNGRTVADSNLQSSEESSAQGWIFILFLVILFFFFFRGKRGSRPVIYTRRGSGSWSSGGWGGGGWGGGSGGGGGGFSGGGGGTSGGGAGGSW